MTILLPNHRNASGEGTDPPALFTIHRALNYQILCKNDSEYNYRLNLDE